MHWQWLQVHVEYVYLSYDIKLYARNEQDFDSLIHTTRIYSMAPECHSD